MSDSPSGFSTELSELEQADIDGMYLRLPHVDHYQLLGVSRTADRREIRDAYFELSRKFHPDVLFGRSAGQWRDRLTEIFQEINRAYETLTHVDRRKEYDRQLAGGHATATQPYGHDAATPAGDDSDDLFGPRTMGSRASATASIPPVEQAATQTFPGPAPAPAAARPKGPVGPRLSIEAARASARAALARKLGGSGARMASLGPKEPAATIDPLTSLGAFREQRIEAERRTRVDQLVRSSEVCMTRNDVAGAVNALVMALQIAPDEENLQQRLQEAQEKLSELEVNRLMADAEAAAKDGLWARAAAAWERAGQMRPEDHTLFGKAALALLNAHEDLPRAADLARRATQIAPRSPEAHAVLARVFLAGGLRASAMAELDTASKLDPTSQHVKELMEMIKA